MLFSSHLFVLLFLPLVLIGFFTLSALRGPPAGRLWLIAASLVFYGWWSLAYLALLVAWIAGDFLLGRRILAARELDPRRSRLWLAFGIVVNLALLGYYKYAAFILDNVTALTGVELAIGAIVLPLAISFHTFQQIAYLVDCHRGGVPRYSFADYLQFVSFFPQLIAGPIVYHHELVPQLKDPATYRFDQRDFAKGLAFFVIGLVKKLCIADPLTVLAAPAFAAAAGAPPPLLEAWVATLAFTLGLYFDFSAYSDMAVGLARMFGIRLPYNFNSPYKATSIVEFWRRWHMTLSRWFRDYLYFPLGGNRKGPMRSFINLAVTMLVVGLWHGAAWTFVVWGALHGLYLIVNHGWRLLAARAAAGGRAISLGAGPSLVLTLLAVMVAWVFFAAPGFAEALAMLSGLLGLNGLVSADSAAALAHFAAHGRPRAGLDELFPYIAMLAGVIAVWTAPNSQEIVDGGAERLPGLIPAVMARLAPSLAVGAAAGAAFLFTLMVMSDVREFVYFQF